MPLSRHLKLKVSKGTSEESLHEVSEDHQMARNQSQNSRILWQNRAEVKGLCADAKQMSLNLSFTIYNVSLSKVLDLSQAKFIYL